MSCKSRLPAFSVRAHPVGRCDAFARLRIERERTIQKLMERGLSGDEFIRAAGLGARRDLDLRRGLLLIGVGVAWAGVTSSSAVRRGRWGERRWRSVSSTCCCGRSMADRTEPDGAKRS